jgi:ATP synthase protein I
MVPPVLAGLDPSRRAFSWRRATLAISKRSIFGQWRHIERYSSANEAGPVMAEGEDSESEDAALRARLAKLSGALDKRQETPSQSNDNKSADASGQSIGVAANLGFRVLIEFVTAVIVGPLIGWQIDSWLSTAPIFLIIFLILGVAAGMLNVYRIGVGSSGPFGGRK